MITRAVLLIATTVFSWSLAEKAGGRGGIADCVQLRHPLPPFLSGHYSDSPRIGPKPARFRREFAKMRGRFPRRPVTPVISGCIGRRSVI